MRGLFFDKKQHGRSSFLIDGVFPGAGWNGLSERGSYCFWLDYFALML